MDPQPSAFFDLKIEAYGTVTNPEGMATEEARAEAYGTVTNPDEGDCE